MRTDLNQLTLRSVPYFFFSRLMLEFASAKPNLIAKYGEDLEKNDVEWTREAEIRTRNKIWH